MTLHSASRGMLRAALPLFATLALVLGTSAWAQQQRPVALPANASYGELKSFRYPQAQIDKKILRVAPGARVYDVNNLSVTHNMVPDQASVLYRLDINGHLSHMWLLRPDEAKAAKQRAKSAKP
jgi:hypothetical protein